MNYYIHTFGCQMNYSDSEKITMIMMQSGFKRVQNPSDALVIILNTCSVRKKGEDKVYSMAYDILKIHKQNGTKCYIGLTGCMIRKTGIRKGLFEKSQKRKATKKIELLKNENEIFNSDDKIFGKTDKIDFVFRIEDIIYLTKILSILLKVEIGNDEKFNEYLKVKQLQENPGSANIVIQTGCDNFCTYCIVPHTRGREKSRNTEEIIQEIKEVVSKGTKEITLIGQNVNSYGKQTKAKLWDNENFKWKNGNPFKTPFRELLEKIDKIEGLDRIRFTSSNPHDMTLNILNSHFDLEKTCNYLHFALQSGDNQILKAMNRKHTYEDFKTQVEYLRSRDPLFSISTDIIVGFPDETEEQFQNTVKAMKELELDFIYIARYSVRPGTYSADKIKETVSVSEKARRWHIINDILGENVKKRSLLMIGRTEEILIQGITKNDKMYGRTRNFKEVHFDENNKLKIGDIVPVKIDKLKGRILEGKIV